MCDVVGGCIMAVCACVQQVCSEALCMHSACHAMPCHFCLARTAADRFVSLAFSQTVFFFFCVTHE